jgi:hypothetical protein
VGGLTAMQLHPEWPWEIAPCKRCGRVPALSRRHKYCGECRRKQLQGTATRPPRPSPVARGYGTAHRLRRKALAPLVATGTVKCARCGKLIGRDTPWDLGHVDGDRSRYLGPEHRRCNRATSSRRAAASRRVTSRDW